MLNTVEDIKKYVDDNFNSFVNDLKDICKIPSVSNSKNHNKDMVLCSQWLNDRLKKMNVQNLQILPSISYPIVYGELPADCETNKTLLVYGHYDVVSESPLESWNTPPYEATIKDENIYGRGTSDMKGNIIASLVAIEAVKNEEKLPVNIKFLFEGAEEFAAGHLKEFIKENTELLKCDLAFNPDAGILSKDTPSIVYGTRGLYTCKIKIKGAKQELHSGEYGGMVHNPNLAMSELIAGFYDSKQNVAIEGFYDNIKKISNDEIKGLLDLGLDDSFYLKETGVNQLWGDKSIPVVERNLLRPTLDVVSIHGGEERNAIPAESTAYFSMRLVPGQNPEYMHKVFTKHLEKNIPKTVSYEIIRHGGYLPSITNIESKEVSVLCNSFEKIWGESPKFTRNGGGLPVVSNFDEYLDVDTILTGVTLPDDNIHGPNEKLHIPTWKKGIATFIHFFTNIES